MRALRLHQVLQLARDGFVGDDRLLGGADGGVIEGLGGDDIAGGLFQVRGAVHIDRHIAGADPVGRFADRVGGFDHPRCHRWRG